MLVLLWQKINNLRRTLLEKGRNKIAIFFHCLGVLVHSLCHHRIALHVCLVHILNCSLHNIELIFDAVIVRFQFVVHNSYEPCRFVRSIQTIDEINDFFAFTRVTKNYSAWSLLLAIAVVHRWATHRK
jgi:hypothetical protein